MTDRKSDAVLNDDASAQQVEDARAVDTTHRVVLTEEDVSAEASIPARAVLFLITSRTNLFVVRPTKSSWPFLSGFTFSRSWTSRCWATEPSSASSRIPDSLQASTHFSDPSRP